MFFSKLNSVWRARADAVRELLSAAPLLLGQHHTAVKSSSWFQKESSDSAQIYMGSVSGGTAVWQPLLKVLAQSWALSENREHIRLTHSAVPFLAPLATNFIQRTYGKCTSCMGTVAASLVTDLSVAMHPVRAFLWGVWRVRFLHSRQGDCAGWLTGFSQEKAQGRA